MVIRCVSISDSEHVVRLDADVAMRLSGYDLRLLAGRVIAMRDNQFHDLQNLIAGDGSVSLSSDPYDLRRVSLGRLCYTLGHGELTLSAAQSQTGRLAGALVPPTAGPVPHVEPYRLSLGDPHAFLPFERTRTLANISADSTHNSATRLTLSHWPGNRTPRRFRANLSTESAMRLIDEPDALSAAGAQFIMTDHFDLDGLASVYALMCPNHARQHRAVLIDIARFGDFARGCVTDSRRLAFALDTLAAQALRRAGPYAYSDPSMRIAAIFRALLPALSDLLEEISIPEPLWRAAEQQHSVTEKLLDHPEARIDSDPVHDLAVFRLPNSSQLCGGAQRRYFGLSPIGFHNRTPCATLAIVAMGDVVIHQRYESWVERISGVPLPRRDLSILAHALNAAERNGSRWYYDGVQHIMPRLGRSMSPQPGRLPPEVVIRELRRVIEIAPAAWLASPGSTNAEKAW